MYRTALAALLAATLAACSRAPEDRPDGLASFREAQISDQAHSSGTPGFYFLPQIAPTTTYGPATEPGLSPVVDIEDLSVAPPAILATYTRESGPGGVTVNASGAAGGPRAARRSLTAAARGARTGRTRRPRSVSSWPARAVRTRRFAARVTRTQDTPTRTQAAG